MMTHSNPKIFQKLSHFSIKNNFLFLTIILFLSTNASFIFEMYFCHLQCGEFAWILRKQLNEFLPRQITSFFVEKLDNISKFSEFFQAVLVFLTIFLYFLSSKKTGYRGSPGPKGLDGFPGEPGGRGPLGPKGGLGIPG